MTREEIRLEVLKLSHRHDRGPEAVVEHAKVYEKYVSEVLVEPQKTEKKPSLRKVENVNPLS